MLNARGFDLWADGYDSSVSMSEDENIYPFAGYRDVLARVFALAQPGPGRRVLDIGFGTGTLTAALYARGCEVWGVDFSPRMLALAQEKMPGAHLFCADFAAALPGAVRAQRFDAITSTYALHHLTDEDKAAFLSSLLPLLAEGGQILIGDVAFATRAQRDACRAASGGDWDEEEFYLVYEDAAPFLPARCEFSFFSPCAGVLCITP